MSTFVGLPQEILVPSGLLGNRSILLNNPTWCNLITGHFVTVTSATVGNRLPFFNFCDSAGNIIFVASQGNIMPANTTAHFNLGSGITYVGWSAGLPIYVAIPRALVLPPQSFILTGDYGVADPANDTVSGAFIVSY